MVMTAMIGFRKSHVIEADPVRIRVYHSTVRMWEKKPLFLLE
jgi:hypothetical protein